MAEFLIKQVADRSPTECLFCKRHVGPFIETGIDLPVHGHVWICLGDEDRPGCAVQMGRLAGMLDASIAEHLRADVARYQHDIAELERARDEGPITMTAAEVRKLVRAR